MVLFLLIPLLFLFSSSSVAISQRRLDGCTVHHQDGRKRAIVVGASVGMGREIAKMLAADGYIVGVASRRITLLETLQDEIPTETHIAYMDAAKPYEAVDIFNDLVKKMGGLDLLVLALTGFHDARFNSLEWTESLPVLEVDIIGFLALAWTGLSIFEKQGYGHLVGFSSIDGLYGIASAPEYSAAKAFCSRYLQAQHNKYVQRDMPIYITDICPGWVHSHDSFNPFESPSAYWVESLEDACKEIFDAIKNKVPIAYITKRWEKVAELLAWIPNDLYNALSARPGGGF